MTRNLMSWRAVRSIGVVMRYTMHLFIDLWMMKSLGEIQGDTKLEALDHGDHYRVGSVDYCATRL